jgi:hypothetical protein
MLVDTYNVVDVPLPDSPLPQDAKLTEGNKQAHFYAIRQVVDCMTAANTDTKDSILPHLYSRLNALEANSLYWAPEIFQFKLMPFIHNLTSVLNEKFEANAEIEVAWAQFMVNWSAANTSLSEIAPSLDSEPTLHAAPTKENAHSAAEPFDLENSSISSGGG